MLRVLADPLLIALVVVIFAILSYSRRRAAAMVVIAITILLLTALSMPIVAAWLQDTLAVPRGADTMPDFIVVLSGGMNSGAYPDLDTLDEETMERVLFGVHLWKRYPSSRLVVTGAMHTSTPGRKTQLMAELAQCRGVPAASIIVEPRAMNTREHPLRLRAMGIPPASRLAIVTSSWHERRAMIEFRKYFPNATPQPVPHGQYEGAGMWVPDFPGLRESTYATREWAAIAWYRIRDAIGR